MANVAQLVNCSQTLFLANGDDFCVTAPYHVFAVYMDHRNGQALRTEFSAPRIPYQYPGKSQHVVRLAGSAFVLNGTLTLRGMNTLIIFSMANEPKNANAATINTATA